MARYYLTVFIVCFLYYSVLTLRPIKFMAISSYKVQDIPLKNTPLLMLKDFFELTDEELVACNDLIRKIKDEVIKKDPNIDGFNLGTNIGRVSGQSILHCHFHLIPRRLGDVENPQGGVRSVIPNKQHYKRKK